MYTDKIKWNGGSRCWNWKWCIQVLEVKVSGVNIVFYVSDLWTKEMTRLDIYFDFLLILLSEKPSAKLFDLTNPDWAPH